MQKTYSIDLISDLPAMAELREEWNELWSKAAVRTPYQRWEWNHAWIVGSGQEQNLFVLVARDADNVLRGIAPLVRRRVAGMLGVVSFISQEASCYPDFIIVAGEEEKVITAFLKYFNNNNKVSSLRLKIANPTPTINVLQAINPVWGGGMIELCPYTQRPLVCVGVDYDNYIDKLSSKMRKQIKYALRKIRQKYELRFVSTYDELDLYDAMKIIFKLNAMRWGGNPEKSHLIHRQCYKALHEIEMAGVFVLYCNDRPVAGISALMSDKYFFIEVAGFDYSVMKVDLGKVFYDFVFRWALSRGCEKIDFGSGEEDYKFRYKPDVYEKYNVTLNKSLATKKLLEMSENFSVKRRELMRAVKRLVKPIVGGKNG